MRLAPLASAARRPAGSAGLLVLVVLALFWWLSLRHLTVVPRVYEDEPWQASSAWKIASEGVFGTDLFAGFYGMEQRYYGYMPVHPLLLAGVFRAAGPGLFQARFEPVALALLALALTYSLGRRLFGDARIGLLAVALLLAARLHGPTPSHPSGVLWLDMARISRYDMTVPVLGLAALHAYLRAGPAAPRRWCFLAGLLAGLAGLGHLYGAFWLPVLLILAVWDRRRGAEILALLAGFALPWAAYAAYVLGDVADWRGQTQGYANRFDLLNPWWYVVNVLEEPQRYGPGLRPDGPWGWLLRPAVWGALIAVPLSLAGLAWRALWRGERAARILLVPLVLFPALFALLIRLKLSNYLVSFMPLVALAVAWGAHELWRRAAANRGRWLRSALAALLVLVLVEGATRVVVLEAAGRSTTPYYTVAGSLRALLPPGGRVLALHDYWFGLEDYDYRSFVVPLAWSDGNSVPSPMAFGDALDRVDPDAVLIEPSMRDYFAGAAADDPKPAEFRAWLERRGAWLAGRVDDPTYGLIEVYRIP